MADHDDAYELTDIAFDAEGTTLRGWLYRPRSRVSAAPVVVMAHGYNCLKELYLDKYAESIARAGHFVVAYDHRNFGGSDGEPRQELDPWLQVRDYRHAVTFAQTLDGVDPGGKGAERRYVSGESPTMVSMVVDPAAGGPASHASADAWEFFTGKNAPPEDQWRFRKWRNEITLRSLELYSEYEPGSFVERISPTPLLMIVGDADVVCPTDLALAAFNRAHAPKRLELYPGGHFSAYTDQFERAATSATEWFAEHLRADN